MAAIVIAASFPAVGRSSIVALGALSLAALFKENLDHNLQGPSCRSGLHGGLGLTRYRHLLRTLRDMNEVDQHARIPLLRKMTRAVKQIVAAICARRIRNRRRYTLLAARLRHGINRCGGKIGIGSPRNHRLVARLEPFVIRNARVTMIDGHILGRYLRTTRSNACAQNGIGLFPLNEFFDNPCGIAKHNGHALRHNVDVCHALWQATHSLP